MLDYKKELSKYNLDSTNSVIIAFGPLQALGLKESKDIDIVVDSSMLEKLALLKDFRKEEYPEGHYCLRNGVLQIGDKFLISKININWTYNYIFKNSFVLDGLRYMKLDFVLKIKKLLNRPKDIHDIELIEEYLSSENRV